MIDPENFEQPFPDHPVFSPVLRFANPSSSFQNLTLNLSQRFFHDKLNPASKVIKKQPSRKGMKYRRRSEGYNEVILKHYYGSLPPSEE